MTTAPYHPSTHRVGAFEINLEHLLLSLQRILHWRHTADDGPDATEPNFWGRLVHEIIEETRCDAFSVQPWEWLKKFFYCVEVAGGLNAESAVEFNFKIDSDRDESNTVRSVSIVWSRLDIRVEWTWKRFGDNRVASVYWEWRQEVKDAKLKQRIDWVILGE
jgi:hypothetical protein